MITTESESMRLFLRSKRWIIGVALGSMMLLAGCSMVRLAYSQGPTLVHWWADGYIDFTSEQSRRFKESLDDWFDWHRRTQMPDYAALLARGQREVMGPMTREGMCAWRDEVQQRLDPLVDRTAPALAALALTLTPAQLAHLDQRLARNGAEMKRDFAQDDRQERREASFKRTLKRYEDFYGRFDAAQKERLAQLLQQSPFDADQWLAERERRNRDTIATLRNLIDNGKAQDSGAAQAAAVAAVKLIAERSLRSPRSEYRAYQDRLSADNCGLAAALHNIMTPAQREHARNKLRGWEADVRAIVASDSPKATQGVADPTLLR
jgi:Family of unknown function (DUF6279)